MKLTPAWTIKRKLLALIAASLICAQALAAAFSLFQEAQRYAALKQATLSATAQVMAAAAARPTEAGDAQAARDALRAIGRIDDVAYVGVSNAAGVALADLGSSELLGSDLRLDEKSPPLGAFDLFGVHAIDYSTPIVLGGKIVGRLDLIGELKDFSARVRAVLAQTLVGAALALALALLVSGKMQNAITGPLTVLAQTMTRVRDGHDYSTKLAPGGNDEIGVLVASFNAMIGEIGERDKKLAAHREQLEQEVADRTEDFRRAKESAEQANGAKSDFLATMSHEIRTPMNGVLVMAELLAASDLAPRARRQAEIIARSGQSLLAIINDILDFSKIEAGKLEVEHLAVDPVETVETTLNLFHERAQTKGLDLAALFEPGLAAPIVADPVRLGQVLGNLVNNALKFTESGFVQVVVGPDPVAPGRVRFAVRDTGCGIAPEKLGAVFGAFEQADQSTTRKYGGTGLGLAIAKKLVLAMGGDLRVESDPGRGASFFFSLPAANDAQELTFPRLVAPRRATVRIAGEATAQAVAALLRQARFAVTMESPDAPLGALEADAMLVVDAKRLFSAPRRLGAGPIVAIADLGDGGAENLIAREMADTVVQRPLARQDLAMICAALRDGRSLRDQRRVGRADKHFAQYVGRRVLVADDSPVNREVAAAALARFGVTIDLVENGVEAVAAVGKQNYHLVLMDGSMPEMDGFEAARKIRANERTAGRPRLPIVALTAHVVGAAAEAWREAEMDGILHKPFTLQALAECLSAWLGEASAEATAESLVATPKTATLESEESPVLDPQVIGQLRELAAMGKPEFLHRVCALYRQHAPETFAQMRDAFVAGDRESLGRLAHGLKSMSYNIGAARVAEAALGLERLTRADRKLPQADDLATLETEVSAALAALEEVSPSETSETAQRLA